MEILLILLGILLLSSMIGISMIAFNLAIKSLKKINSLEELLKTNKNEKL